MNYRRTLSLSLVLNLLLAGSVLLTLRFRGSKAEPAAALRKLPERVVRLQPLTNRDPAVLIQINTPFHWREVESTDYRIYLKNLREVGCPEKTIRDIIVADINEFYSRKIKALVDSVSDQFWSLMVKKSEMERVVEEKSKELESLKKERADLLTELLNDSAVDDKIRQEEQNDQSAKEDLRLSDFLSEEKIADLGKIINEFSVKRQELNQRWNELSPNDREQQSRQLVAQQEAEIRKLLTPDEFEEYKLRSGPMAALRFQLADFETTEDEMHAIARARMNSIDDVKQLLGPERFAAFERSQDQEYQEGLRITDRFAVSPSAAVEIYQMRKAVEAQARNIREDRTRPLEERRNILKSMQVETERSISDILGQKVFQSYREHAGDWLSRFSDGLQ